MAQVGNQVVNDRYAIYHADCMDVMRSLPDECIDATIVRRPRLVERA
jgi:predicted methyltransferase